MPCFAGIGFLAFANTAWPHHPGEKTERMHNTRILLVPKLLNWLMLNQNYHLVHHLKPNVPWYDYVRYWNEHGQNLEAQGAVVSDFRLHLPHLGQGNRNTHSSI
jgi:fatty acid desaturase